MFIHSAGISGVSAGQTARVAVHNTSVPSPIIVPFEYATAPQCMP